MTPSGPPQRARTGCAEVAEGHPAEIIVNVQGDEAPLTPPPDSPPCSALLTTAECRDGPRPGTGSPTRRSSPTRTR
jgi:CMP-2-keto-3-deoxyoctulosonic acid synthetase